MQRGYQAIEKLIEHGLSRSGASSIIQAFDPFHDIPVSDPQGWPDIESGASVTRLYKQSITLAVPQNAQFPAGVNWDLHIVAWPNLLPCDVLATSARYGNNFQFADANYPNRRRVGGVAAYACVAGFPLDLSAGNLTCYFLGQLTLPSSVTAGSGRLTGYGFEVHNTTAELYKQGSVAVYRQQSNYPQLQGFDTYQVLPSALVGSCDFSMVRFPPATLADALLLNGSQQWEAKDGCYVVANFMSSENPALPIPNSSFLITAAETDDVEAAASTINMNAPAPLNVGAPFTKMVFPAHRVHPVHQSGAIFTGLSYTSTLTLNANIYYEAFPYTYDKDILVLAKPSNSYDPKALVYYSELMQHSPVGVPVKMNGLGDWFAMGLSKLASSIGGVMSNLPGIPGMIGAGAKWIGDSLPQYIEGPKKKNKPQKVVQVVQQPRQQAAVVIPGNTWGPGVPASRNPKILALQNNGRFSRQQFVPAQNLMEYRQTRDKPAKKQRNRRR